MKKHLTKLGSMKAQAFLEALLNSAVVCAAVVQMKDQFVYKRIWASFTRIEVGPFPPDISMRLIDHFLDNYPIRVIDRELYRREVLKAVNGNPFLIKNLIGHTSRELHVGLEDIRGIRRVEDGPFFNMGPIYIFAACSQYSRFSQWERTTGSSTSTSRHSASLSI